MPLDHQCLDLLRRVSNILRRLGSCGDSGVALCLRFAIACFGMFVGNGRSGMTRGVLKRLDVVYGAENEVLVRPLCQRNAG